MDDQITRYFNIEIRRTAEYMVFRWRQQVLTSKSQGPLNSYLHEVEEDLQINLLFKYLVT